MEKREIHIVKEEKVEVKEKQEVLKRQDNTNISEGPKMLDELGLFHSVISLRNTAFLAACFAWIFCCFARSGKTNTGHSGETGL